MQPFLKWFYDENRIFPIEAILKHKHVLCLTRKMRLLFSNISFYSWDIQVFKICKLAKWWRHILNQILIRYDQKRYLGQFVAEMFDFLQ